MNIKQVLRYITLIEALLYSYEKLSILMKNCILCTGLVNFLLGILFTFKKIVVVGNLELACLE